MEKSVLRWKIVEVLITLHQTCREAKDASKWKAPFKKLKKSTIRGEEEWRLLLVVDEKEIKKVFELTDGRFQVEALYEESEDFETWEEKVICLGPGKPN